MTPVLLTLFLSLQATDTALTCRNLARGYQEVNPLLPSSCVGVGVIKGASTTGLVWLAQQHLHGHQRAWFYLINAGIAAIPVWQNGRVK